MPAGSSSASRPRPGPGSRRPSRSPRPPSRRSSEEVGEDAVEISVGYVGVIPSSYPINAIYQWTGGPEEALLRVALREESGVDVEALKRRLRETLTGRDAGRAVLVRAGGHRQRRHELRLADARSRSPSAARTSPDDRAYAAKVRDELAKVPSLRDLQYAQALDYPTVSVEIDRERAGLSGVTAEEVARSLVDGHLVEPLRRAELLARPEDRHRLPGPGRDPRRRHGLGRSRSRRSRSSARAGRRSCSGTWPRSRRGTMPGEYDRYNMKRSISLTANIAGEDLGRVAGRVSRGPRAGRARRPRG